MSIQWQIRRGTRAELDAISLAEGELGYVTDEDRIYVGDGSTNYLVGRVLYASGTPADPGIAGVVTIDTATGKVYYSNGTNQVLTGYTAAITGGTITGITDLAVADGGTGASTLTDGGILVGSGTSAITALAAMTDGQLPIGSTGADPVPAALTAGDGIDVTNAAGSITIAADVMASSGITFSTGELALDLKSNGGIVLETGTLAVDLGASSLTGTLAVGDGGSGATTLTDHGVLVGSGTSAITALAVGTDGQVLVGSTGADPVFASITAGDGIDLTAGAGTLEIDVDIKSAGGLEIDTGELSLDIKSNGGIVLETGELAVDLGASSITGTLAVGDGGTGATTLTDHGVVLGSGTAAVSITTAGTAGQPLLSGGASADPDWGTLGVSYGGSGATSLTDHGVLVGSGTSAITAVTVGTNGQVLVGSTGADPVFATVTAGDGLSSTVGAGTLEFDVDLKSNSGLTIDAGQLSFDLGASSITGTLAVADGGTGTTNGSITGTGALSFTAGGSAQDLTLTSSTTGAVVAKPATNSTAAVKLANAAGTAILQVDSTNSRIGINTTGPDRALDILDASNPQLRLTQADGSVFTDINSASDGYLYIYPTSVSSNGYYIQIMGDSNYTWIGVDEGAGSSLYVANSRISDGERQPIVIRGSDILLNAGSGEPVWPAYDDSNDLGTGSKRWDDIYATNGTIQTSDVNNKEDIISLPLGLDFVNQLRPVQFKYKSHTKEYDDIDPKTKEKKKVEITTTHSRKHTGLIAQEVKSLLDDLEIPTTDFAGYVDTGNGLGLRYTEFIAPMIKAIQELTARVEALESA